LIFNCRIKVGLGETILPLKVESYSRKIISKLPITVNHSTEPGKATTLSGTNYQFPIKIGSYSGFIYAEIPT
jgi:hypothetical protein